MSESATKDRGFILVGVDGSEPSLEALRWAARQATLTGAALRVLVSWELPSFTGWAPVFPLEYDPEQIAGKILDEALRDALGPDSGAGTEGLAVERIVVEGHPAPALIVAAARCRAARGRAARATAPYRDAYRLGLRASRCPRSLLGRRSPSGAIWVSTPRSEEPARSSAAPPGRRRSGPGGDGAPPGRGVSDERDHVRQGLRGAARPCGRADS